MTTVAQMIEWLKQLKETKHGSAIVDDEDVPDELKSTSALPKENEWDTDSNVHKRWDWILDEMIFAFEHKVHDESLEYNDEIEARVKSGFVLFRKYYQGSWD